jgi:hypothetical protein
MYITKLLQQVGALLFFVSKAPVPLDVTPLNLHLFRNTLEQSRFKHNRIFGLLQCSTKNPALQNCRMTSQPLGLSPATPGPFLLLRSLTSALHLAQETRSQSIRKSQYTPLKCQVKPVRPLNDTKS